MAESRLAGVIEDVEMLDGDGHHVGAPVLGQHPAVQQHPDGDEVLRRHQVGDGGALSPVGSWEGVPATVAGLAAS